MLERLWTSFLDLTAQLVTPDWGRIIGLLPVVMVILVVLVLLRTFAMLARAPKLRRDVMRPQPRTPAGIHMPGPSFAPVFASVGLFLLFLGLVFGGPTLILGAIALVLTLLYWLAEGLRLYDRDIGPTRPEIPAVVPTGPPPGVHMPGPSWRPFLASLGMFLLFLGLVFGGLVLAVGVIALVSTLIGWLVDAVQEYRRTVDADATGHLENGAPPKAPSRLLSGLIVLLVAAVVLQSGLFGSGAANGGTAGATPSGAPRSGAPGSAAPASGGPAASGAASGAPGAGGPAVGSADVTVTAQGIAFLEKTISAPAGKPFTIEFVNQDAGTPHDVAFNDGSGATVWKGEVFNGVATKTYQVPALPAGSYTFICIVHQNMTGTATLQ
ncbi:MAG TPA: cupredoxin domain-containing protein [Candidatus Limnocylindrales bacterium]|nr:cupredoxin domain-containing protein [Candidatus Limnocylindrales bacterium]